MAAPLPNISKGRSWWWRGPDNIAPPKEASHCNVAYPYEHPEKDRNDVCWRVFLDIRIAL